MSNKRARRAPYEINAPNSERKPLTSIENNQIVNINEPSTSAAKPRSNVATSAILTTEVATATSASRGNNSKSQRGGVGGLRHTREPTRNRGSAFALTVRLGAHTWPSCRSDLVESSPPSLKYCVALEKGVVGGFCEYHLHAFFEFKEIWSYVELIEWYTNVWPNITVHVEKVKNFKKYISYITKEDLNAIYCEVKFSDLNFYYQAYYTLKEMAEFRVSHPFVVAHYNCYKLLERMHKEIHTDWLNSYSYFGPLVIPPTEWCLQVYKWYRDYVSTAYYPKKKHLYLYGDSNVGKTTFINTLLANLGNRIYYCRSYDPFCDLFEEHRAIVWDEFDFKKVNYSQLKLLLAGEPTPITQKYVCDRMIQNTRPVIIISNNPPYPDNAFLNRVLVVHADVSLQEFFGDTPTTIEDVPTVFTEACTTDTEGEEGFDVVG